MQSTRSTGFTRFERRTYQMAKITAASIIFSCASVSLAFAQTVPPGCGVLKLDNQFGPFDYRADRYVPETSYGSHKAQLFIVENAHFTAEVEAGIRGSRTTHAAGDISYTLQRFPNHHRALVAISKIGIREQSDLPKGAQFSISCWFQRAIIWAPDDPIVRLIYATHLIRTQQLAQAEVQAKDAAALAGDNPFTHMNLGFVYLDMKKYDESLAHAHRALELGLNIQTLQDLLIKEGKWREPTSAEAKNAEKRAP